MRRTFLRRTWVWAAALVFAGACLPAAIARAESTSSPTGSTTLQSWTELHARYDGIVDRVAAAQKSPSAIGGGPAAFTMEEEILRVYRTPSPRDGFWSDFRDRYDRSIEAAARSSPRAAP
jgi:hypothetical protein